jgi:hypothetical protein
LEVKNSVQGIFWRSFNKATTTAATDLSYGKRMPSTVHYTITFTDEYGDEHVTSLLSVEYKSECTASACTTAPDFTKQTLEEHAEAVNQSIGALPLGAIENRYVWTVGTEYTAGAANELAVDPNFNSAGDTKLKYYAYPRDWAEVKKTSAGDAVPISTPVEQLAYRLDEKIIPTGCKGIDITGTATVQQYGLCMFIQLENPGIQTALKVQYFYNPYTEAVAAGNVEAHVVSGQTSGFNTLAITDVNDKFAPDDSLYLVTIQNLQADRKWNAADGDVSKLFIDKKINDLHICSKRGLCDYDTGMCDCFSGYSGIRCDDQNAIAYSY